MQYTIIFYFILISTLRASLIKPKLCIDCKYFTKDFFVSNKFARCSFFPIEKDPDNSFLIDGKISKDMNVRSSYYCSTARAYDSMCGKEGKQFIQKNKK